MDAIDVAKYVISKHDNVGDLITNKKLQKLLYYVKAWGLVYFEDGIIDDHFEAWIHGPVCRSVYQEYKSFGYNPIKIEYKGISSSQFVNNFKTKHKDKAELIDAVLLKYGKLTSLQLEMLTHSEKPWIEARKELSPVETGNNEINEETMRNFYSSKNK